MVWYAGRGVGRWLQMCCEIDDRQGKGNSAISRYYCRCHHIMKVSHSASGIFLGSVTSPPGDRQVSDVFASSSAAGLARLIHTAVPGEQPIGDRRRHGNQRTILFRARQAEGGVDVPNGRKYCTTDTNLTEFWVVSMYTSCRHVLAHTLCYYQLPTLGVAGQSTCKFWLALRPLASMSCSELQMMR